MWEGMISLRGCGCCSRLYKWVIPEIQFGLKLRPNLNKLGMITYGKRVTIASVTGFGSLPHLAVFPQVTGHML